MEEGDRTCVHVLQSDINHQPKNLLFITTLVKAETRVERRLGSGYIEQKTAVKNLAPSETLYYIGFDVQDHGDRPRSRSHRQHRRRSYPRRPPNKTQRPRHRSKPIQRGQAVQICWDERRHHHRRSRRDVRNWSARCRRSSQRWEVAVVPTCLFLR